MSIEFLDTVTTWEETFDRLRRELESGRIIHTVGQCSLRGWLDHTYTSFPLPIEVLEFALKVNGKASFPRVNRICLFLDTFPVANQSKPLTVFVCVGVNPEEAFDPIAYAQQNCAAHS